MGKMKNFAATGSLENRARPPNAEILYRLEIIEGLISDLAGAMMETQVNARLMEMESSFGERLSALERAVKEERR